MPSGILRSVDDFTVFDIETDAKRPWNGKLLRSGIGGDRGARTWYGWRASDRTRVPDADRMGRMLLARPGVVVCQTQFDFRWFLLDGARLHPRCDLHDLRTMCWLLEEDESFNLADMMLRHLGEAIAKPIKTSQGTPVWDTSIVPVPGRSGRIPMDEVPDDIMDEYSLADLDEERRLYLHLRRLLQREGLWEMFLRDEVPLAASIVRLEAAGMPFDREANDELLAKVTAELDELGDELQRVVGAPINLRSSDQTGRYMFTRGELGIKGVLELDDAMREVIEGVGRKRPGDEVDPRAAALNDNREGVLPDRFVAGRVGRLYVHGEYVIEGRGLKAPKPKRKSGHQAVRRVEAGQQLTATREWSTSSTDLVMDNVDDPFVQDFVLWRELDRLTSFLDKYPNYIGPDGRLHGTINRCGTVTGRFSSSEPNLQNIPAHGQYGPAVRSLIRGELAVADFSQLENRVLAHFSLDANLMKAYEEGLDLYGLAASILFGGDPSKDHPQRGLMKTTILSLQYGAGYVKLAMLMTRGGHPTDPAGAKELVNRLKREAFPRMFEWRDETMMDAIRTKVVETLGGRRRRLPFDDDWEERRAIVFSAMGSVRSRRASEGKGWRGGRSNRSGEWVETTDNDLKQLTMERQAVNARVSGSAADIVAGTMLACERVAEPGEYTMLVQVHDEIVWERGPNWQGEASLAKLRWAGEEGHGYKLEVPLKFDPSEVSDWSQKGVTQTGEGHVVKDRLAKARSEGMQARKASDYAADLRAMRGENRQNTAGSGDEKGVVLDRLAEARRRRREAREAANA